MTFQNVINNLADFLKDPKGQNSSMRIAAIIVTTIVIFTWTYISIFETGELADIPMTVFYVVAFLWGSKQVQRFFEAKEIIEHEKNQLNENN